MIRSVFDCNVVRAGDRLAQRTISMFGPRCAAEDPPVCYRLDSGRVPPHRQRDGSGKDLSPVTLANPGLVSLVCPNSRKRAAGASNAPRMRTMILIWRARLLAPFGKAVRNSHPHPSAFLESSGRPGITPSIWPSARNSHLPLPGNCER